MEVRDPVGASVGDEVQIGIPPGPVVWASVVVYVFPVVGMLLGAALGLHYAPEGHGDEAAAIGCFGALALCFAVIWVYDRTQKHRKDRTPVVVRVLAPGSSASQNACPDDL